MSSIDPLLAGFRRFHDEYFERHPAAYHALATEGQAPRAVVLSCCDSRDDPALLLDAAPGELFVLRNIANVVPPYTSADTTTGAGLEFAVRDLQVPHVIVLGHAQCGGIQATLEIERGRPPARDHLPPWLELARPAVAAALAEQPAENECAARAECHNVAASVRRLRDYPWIDERVQAGTLAVHGWWFDLAAGALHAVDPESARPRPLA